MSSAPPMRKRSELPGLRCSLDEMRGASKPDEDEVESAVEAAYARAEHLRRAQTKRDESGLLHEVFNASAMLADAANALVDDSFFRCFTSAPPDPWNWNLYLFPLWCAGFLVRHLVLFPARLLFLAFIMTLFFIAFIPVQLCMKDTPTRREIERRLVRFAAFGWVASWTGVIKYHGPKPVPAPNRVWVANHTSMIDYTILCQYVPFAAIMQLQPGWVGFLQTRVLQCLGCLWFNRTEVKDRKLVSERMKQHILDPNSTPLLIFPEGTCVNNEYTVMFKQGAFSLGATVCPVAIKYNKIFVDAFWNSRRQQFTTHIFKLMTSWAVVADIYFLPPQTLQEGEDPTQFATRVQQMIAEVAKLRIVPWDGYLKYYNLAEKRPQLVEARRSTIADALLKKFKPAEEISSDKKQPNN